MKLFAFVLLIGSVLCGILSSSNLKSFFDLSSFLIVFFPVIGSIPARHGLEAFGKLLVNNEERKKILNTMGTTGIVSGVLGTQIGFVTMLTKLDDPKSIGPAMAVALLASFYGVFTFFLTTILSSFLLGNES